MPVMDGLEACKIIVGRRKNDGLPKVVFATAHVSSSFQEKTVAAGGDGYISKPFDLDKIKGYLSSLYE